MPQLEPRTPLEGSMIRQDNGSWLMTLKPGDGVRVELAFAQPGEHLPVGEKFEWDVEAGIVSNVTPSGHEWCLWQWHAHYEPALAGSNPMLMLMLKDGVGCLMVCHEYSQPFDKSKRRMFPIAEGIKLNPGQLYRWHVEAKIAADGFVKVRRDGVLIADYVGPLGYNMTGKPYAKAGIYKWQQPWAGEIKALVRF